MQHAFPHATLFAPAALVLAMAGDSVRWFDGGVNHLFVGRPSSASATWDVLDACSLPLVCRLRNLVM